MRKMKKMVALCMAGMMALSLAACSGGAKETTAAATTETKAETAAQTTAEEKAQETTAEASSGSVSPEEFAKQEHGPIFEDIIKNGKLKVGIIGNNPTFCFHTVKDGKDELVGFEVEGMYEMAKRLSDYLGREVTVDFYESDLEQALITHLQKFLLELGRGFSFVARQKRITFDGRHFRIDLVFYNYILKCFVLIDLKVGDLTHQDLGQMQMYVHYYERELMNEGDNPPIGIVLCADKSESVVKYTLPENETQIFASKYKLYLPSEEELLRELKQEYQALESIKALEKNSGSED